MVLLRLLLTRREISKHLPRDTSVGHTGAGSKSANSAVLLYTISGCNALLPTNSKLIEQAPYVPLNIALFCGSLNPVVHVDGSGDDRAINSPLPRQVVLSLHVDDMMQL